MNSKTNSTFFSHSSSLISEYSYWKSVDILLTKQHVINKRLWGSKILFKEFSKLSNIDCDLIINCKQINEDIEDYRKYISEILKFQDQVETDCLKTTEVVLLELLPKAYSDNHAFQLIILEKANTTVRFYDVSPKDLPQKLCPEFYYSLRLDSNTIVLNAQCDISSKSCIWLKDTVIQQFVKWAEETNKQHNNVICHESLSLVSNDRYYEKYNELKRKYGKEMVKIWPECTDPSKFVYEDVAIATYLLMLWEDEKNHLRLQSLQTFVDLGCGNGLLVYILTKEGHQGVGVDVRRRHIWDMYSKDVILEERTITPSDAHLFPNTDWIIGNHSDELTPWIPVIAARSSYKCNFFLLPCCAFNFDGTKYQRQNSSKSQYTEYLQYIQQLCEDCGFQTDIDRLKIPSTKRICLVGRGRTHAKQEYNRYCSSINYMINVKKTATNMESKESVWIKDFKAREPVERVRNCTQIDKNLIKDIVQKISSHLIKGCTLDSLWSAGNIVDINEVVELIPQKQLNALKSECGGLQTLLKNNHHIFKVHGGKVQLRHPKTVEEVNSISKGNKSVKVKIKQRPCWFYSNHPQGCPLKDNECSFTHETSKE